MSSIIGQIETQHPELFVLEFGKIAHYDFVYTLSSKNINQSAPNLVKLYVIIRSRMSVVMDLIGPELFELSALALENLTYLTWFTPSICKYLSINTKLGHSIYMPIRSRMSSIMGQIEPEHPELSALKYGKMLNMTLFTLYQLQILTNQHQTWSNCM